MASLTVDPPFYLPIRRSAAELALLHGDLPESPMECAGLFALTMAIRSAHRWPVISRMLFDAQSLAISDKEHFVEGLASLVKRELSGYSLDSIERRLDALGLYLLPDSFSAIDPSTIYTDTVQISMRQFVEEEEIRIWRPKELEEDLDADLYDSEKEAKPPIIIRFSGSQEQHAVLRAIAVARDEPLYTDAHAGSGKSAVVRVLAENADSITTYLVESARNIDGSLPEVAARKVLTTADLAFRMFALAGLKRPFFARAKTNATDRCVRAGINGFTISPPSDAPWEGSEIFAPEQVLLACEAAISSFVWSEDATIGEKHFLRTAMARHWRLLAPKAEQLFKTMMTAGLAKATFSISIAHGMKWLELKGVPIPEDIGMILVDEAHDLSSPIARMLARHQRGALMLGDERQRIVKQRTRQKSRAEGRSAMRGMKTLAMSQSFRAGRGLESIVKPLELIGGSTEYATATFRGSPAIITRVRHYDTPHRTPRDGFRVFGNPFALFAEALHLKNQGARFAIRPASRNRLRNEVANILDLVQSKGMSTYARPGMHHSLSAFAASMSDLGLSDVCQLLTKGGYSIADLDQLFSLEVPWNEAVVTLCMLEDAKNVQSPRVIIEPSCFLESVAERFDIANAIYLAATRAQSELWIPGDGLDRVRTFANSAE
ncbi:MAG: hypothetical protein O9256_00455 [Rhizobiaceae bacterium]|nr:hypothetical protein [Rhizobiaceae bacterium]